jgi:hypothetical protein
MYYLPKYSDRRYVSSNVLYFNLKWKQANSRNTIRWFIDTMEIVERMDIHNEFET